jgi:hypothetical protein
MHIAAPHSAPQRPLKKRSLAPVSTPPQNLTVSVPTKMSAPPQPTCWGDYYNSNSSDSK